MCLLKNHAENETGRLVLDLFLFFEKDLYEAKASGLHLVDNPDYGKQQKQTV